MCERLDKTNKINGRWHYNFICKECNTVFEARGDFKPKSCGCLHKPLQQAPENSYWRILEPVNNYKTKVEVLCINCNTKYTRYPQKIVTGENISCFSCKEDIRMKEEFKQYGGKRKHPLYNVWDAMNQRCYNPNNPYYHNYGGRGVYVCDEWKSSSETFILWALQNGWEEGLQIDKDKLSMEQGLNIPHYSPDTVCFLSPMENSLYTKLSVANTSGVTGVHFRPNLGKYETYFNYLGKRYRAGLHTTLEDAVNALIKKQKEVIDNG